MRVQVESNTVAVPKAFFESYLSMLSLDQMRVYLLLAASKSLLSLDVCSIALRLNMTISQVLDALSRLQSVGLIMFDNPNEGTIVLLADPHVPEMEVHADTDLLNGIECIKGSPLSPPEISTIIFIKDALHFDDELILYLSSYCRERDCFNKEFIKSVALNWSDNGVDSVDKAKVLSDKRMYEDIVYKVLFHLGRKGNPSPAEDDIISSWKNRLSISDELILYACDLAAVNTDRNRLKYASAILERCSKSGVRTPEELKALSFESDSSVTTGKTLFNNFPQSPVDFEELERLLVDN